MGNNSNEAVFSCCFFVCLCVGGGGAKGKNNTKDNRCQIICYRLCVLGGEVLCKKM